MAATSTRSSSQVSGPSAGHFGLKDFVALLRNEGHRALNGVSAFTLTTGVLHQLNAECRRHSLAERSDADDTGIDRRDKDTSRRADQERACTSTDDTEWIHQVQFVKDFMQFSPNLKLNCGSDSPTSPICLHRFSNLTSLSLQRVPVQRLQGLQLLRNSLTTITVYKGLDKVKELLESCGGDMSAPLSWPQLKIVSLVFNSLYELDDSLRLAPHVQVLDVSNNLLQTCQHFLAYLVDVQQMSLAFNRLTQVPSVSATSRASLTCLVLRGNNLDNLQGLEELTSLLQLDLGENCINKHSSLQPLASLTQLKQLQVDGNPLSYHRLHRPLTASCLARQAANVKFELDKKRLTTSEISVKERLASAAVGYDASKRSREARESLTSRDGESSRIPAAAVLCQPDRGAQVATEAGAANNRRKSRPKKNKARDTEIVDLDDTDDNRVRHTGPPGCVPLPRHLEKLLTDRRQEALEARREIEELRKHYGHNWLQAIEDKDIFNKKLKPSGGAPPASPPKLGKKHGSAADLGSQTSTGSTASQETIVELGVDAQPAVKEESGKSEKLTHVDSGLMDPSKPVMATIARRAAGMSESGASPGLGAPDLIRPSTVAAYQTSTASDEGDGKTRVDEGYGKTRVDEGDGKTGVDEGDGKTGVDDHAQFSAPDKGKSEHSSFPTPDRKSDQGNKGINGSTVQVENSKCNPHKEENNSPTFDTLHRKYNTDNEPKDIYKLNRTAEVTTALGSTAHLPDVIPTRQILAGHTPQIQVAPSVMSGDKAEQIEVPPTLKSGDEAKQIEVPPTLKSGDKSPQTPIPPTVSTQQTQATFIVASEDKTPETQVLSTVKSVDTIVQTQVPSTVKSRDTIQQTQVPSTVKSRDTIQQTQVPSTVKSRDTIQHTQLPSTVKSGDTSSPAYTSASLRISTAFPKDSQTGESVERRDSVGEDKEVMESMFVSCPLLDHEVFILTVTSRYLVEKNFRGKVTERLELASLNQLQWTMVEKPQIRVGDKRTAVMEDDGGHGQASVKNRHGMSKGGAVGGNESIQLDLRFDYLKKDKQSRCYVMDVPDGNRLVSHLQPFLDVRQRQLRAAAKTTLQCLKCNQILPQKQLEHSRYSGKSVQYFQDPTNVPEGAQVCPRCGSSLIIEVLVPVSTSRTTGANSRRRAQNTPSSPIGGKQKATTPLKKVFDRITSPSTFRRKSRTEMVSAEVSSSSTAATKTTATVGRQEMISTPLGITAVSTTPDARPEVADDVSGRDRSSAFRAPANMTRVMAAMEVREDEIVCVENYFSADIAGPHSSNQLAELTSSLRGDPSPRPSLRCDPSPRPSQAHAQQAAYSVSLYTEHRGQFQPEHGSTARLSLSYVDAAMFEDVALKGAQRSSRPIQIEGVVHSKTGPQITRQYRDNDRQEKGGKSVSYYTHGSTSGRDEEGEGGRSHATLYSRSYDRHVYSPTFATSLGGQRANIDSSFGTREVSASMDRWNTFASKAAAPSRGVGLAWDVPSKAGESSSLPKSVAFVAGNVDRARQFAVNSDDVSPVFRSPVNSSLSSDKSDPWRLSESPSRSEIQDVSLESGKRVDGSHTADGGTVLVTPGAGDGYPGERCDDTLSIYDFSDESKRSSGRVGLMEASNVSCESSEDTVCQFEENSGCQNGLTFSPQGRHPETNVSVEETLVKHQSWSSAEAAAGASGTTDGEEVVGDDSRDGDVVHSYAFHQLNHRLTLYMMMALFGTDEEFVCKIQCAIAQYIIPEPYDGMLVMSSQRFYVLKFTSEDRRQPPDQWIKCVDMQPIPELRYIDVGLGGQSLRLEFVTDCSSFTLITGDRDITAHFVEVLHGHLASYASRHGITSSAVVNEDTDQSTVDNLDRDVVSQMTQGQSLLYYCMAFLHTGQGERTPVSVVVTSSELCLVRANHQWPQPRLQGPVTVETVGRQFTVLERQKINNVASLTICPSTMRKVSLKLFSETDDLSTCWRITLPSRQSTGDLVHAISDPWAQEFGVAMEVAYQQIDF